MRRLRNSALFLLLAAVCLPQGATEVISPGVRRVGDRLACKCGTCNNTVGNCPMMQCHYSSPAREKIATMLNAGKSDDEIVNNFVQQEGLSALAAPPTEGFSLVGWIMPWVAVAIGLGLITWWLKRYRPKHAAANGAPPEDENLARYKDRIDQDLDKLE